MTKKEKREMMIKKIKENLDAGRMSMRRICLYDEAIDTMDESEKRLNQVAEMPKYNYVNASLVSDINVKYEDS